MNYSVNPIKSIYNVIDKKRSNNNNKQNLKSKNKNFDKIFMSKFKEQYK